MHHTNIRLEQSRVQESLAMSAGMSGALQSGFYHVHTLRILPPQFEWQGAIQIVTRRQSFG